MMCLFKFGMSTVDGNYESSFISVEWLSYITINNAYLSIKWNYRINSLLSQSGHRINETYNFIKFEKLQKIEIITGEYYNY